jgi:hypothetical protein
MRIRRLQTLNLIKNRILVALSQSDKTECGKDNFDEQSVPQKVFSSIWALEAEVNNGGFSQYFFNSSCETAGFVVEALKTVGALQMAEICRQAIATAFPDGLPSDLELIRSAAADFPDETEARLRALDEHFFQYPNDLTELLYKYVSDHPEEFGELPDSGNA